MCVCVCVCLFICVFARLWLACCLLAQADPWQGQDCQRPLCLLCRTKNETEKDCSKEQNIFLDQLSAPTNGDNYNSIYNIEAEVVKEKLEKSEEAEETQDQVSLMEGKSSLDSELPATSFYQTSVPSPLAKKQESQGGGGDSTTNSMLDFCISRSGSEQAASRAKNVYKFQPQVRKPSLVRNRKKSYKRSKSYAGGTVSLSQCPLCARLFER